MNLRITLNYKISIFSLLSRLSVFEGRNGVKRNDEACWQSRYTDADDANSGIAALRYISFRFARNDDKIQPVIALVHLGRKEWSETE